MKKKGRPFSDKAPTSDDLFELYTTKGLSIRKIAAIVGTSKDVVFHALQRYEIKRRPKLYYSKLWLYTLKQIENRIAKKGIVGASVYFGVHHSTLSHHLMRRKVAKRDLHTHFHIIDFITKRSIDFEASHREDRNLIINAASEVQRQPKEK